MFEEIAAGDERLVTVLHIVERRARAAPNAPVIEAAGSPILTNKALLALVDATSRRLRSSGFGRNARVALVLGNGPEFAAAATSLASCVTCAPLNPDLPRGVWAETFDRMKIEALCVDRAVCPDAAQTAEALGLPVFDIVARPDQAAGWFNLSGGSAGAVAEDGPPSIDDVAFVLPTSGTTSSPKTVPLTHLNISHSAHNTASSLRLSREDRLLGVLPLHHAHGLISGLMSTLVSGACVICMRGFVAAEFFEHLRDFRPTWYTAVPAIHQAILDAAAGQPDAVRAHSLRLVRSASAPLPDERYAALATLFGAPVIETFGMTEAASQVASNPLDPGRRKTGSVGVAAGPEIRVVNEDGDVCPSEMVGEIALRGPNLTTGYDETDETRAAFTADGWFLTGDLGRLDSEGYLFIVGRLKEVINRGGEKLLPQRIERVLATHDAVKEAAVFAALHPRLGEDVAAAVVLRDGAELSEAELRSYAARSQVLSDAEVPRAAFFVTDLPKTITGKVQRSLLKKQFASALDQRSHASSERDATSDTERRVAEIWADVLKASHIGRNDDFFRLGGDSLLAAQIAMRIENEFGAPLSLRAMFDAPTVAEVASLIDRRRQSEVSGFTMETSGGDGRLCAPVTVAQERILNLEAGLKGFPSYVVPLMYQTEGVLDLDRFKRAVQSVFASHSALQSVFKRVDDEWRSVPSDVAHVRIEIEDWTWSSEEILPSFMDAALESEIWDVFDLTKDILVRFRLLKFSDEAFGIILICHHAAMDNWAIKSFMEAVFQRYQAFEPGHDRELATPRFQFSDFARWQRMWCEGPEADRQLSYWRRRLVGFRSVLPKTSEESWSMPGFGTERVEVRLNAQTVSALARRGNEEGGTLFMSLLAVLKLFLFERFGESDICISAPIANRARPRTGDMLGLIANNVALRSRLDESSSFQSAVRRVRETVLSADARQEIPFELVVDRLSELDEEAAGDISDVYFSLVDHFEPDISVDGIRLSRIDHALDKTAPMPFSSAKLMFLLKLTDGCIAGSCVFRPTLLSRPEAENLIEQFIAAVERYAGDADPL